MYIIVCNAIAYLSPISLSYECKVFRMDTPDNLHAMKFIES